MKLLLAIFCAIPVAWGCLALSEGQGIQGFIFLSIGLAMTFALFTRGDAK